MKTIEEIEKMSLEDLETIARDSELTAPSDLGSQIESAIIAHETGKKKPGRSLWYALPPAFAAAAVAVAFVVAKPAEPADTFTDPALAYAQLEKTFSYISSKMDQGIQIAEESAPVFTIINDIY